MYEVIFIWSQRAIQKQFQMINYTPNRLSRYTLLNRDRIGSISQSLTNIQKQIERTVKTPYPVGKYSGFSTIPLVQRFNHCCLCASMAPLNPSWKKQPWVLLVLLICNFFTLFYFFFCKNQINEINDSLVLGCFTNELLSCNKSKHKKYFGVSDSAVSGKNKNREMGRLLERFNRICFHFAY